MIRRIPVRNAMTNQPELLEGDVLDMLPNDHSVYVDRSGKTYDTTKGVRMGDLPQSGAVQVPLTTWYAFDPKPHRGRSRDRRIHGRSRRLCPDLPREE